MFVLDGHRTIRYMGPRNSRQPLYAKADEHELLELRRLIGSEDYRRIVANHATDPEPFGCGIRRTVRLEHFGIVADFSLADPEELPQPVREVVDYIQRVGAKYFPDFATIVRSNESESRVNEENGQ